MNWSTELLAGKFIWHGFWNGAFNISWKEFYYILDVLIAKKLRNATDREDSIQGSSYSLVVGVAKSDVHSNRQVLWKYVAV